MFVGKPMEDPPRFINDYPAFSLPAEVKSALPPPVLFPLPSLRESVTLWVLIEVREQEAKV